MSDPKTKVTREELHQMVWRQPFVRLAAALGYSYTELVSICADFKIPRPSGGYWYRLEHGGAEEQTPLPPAPSGKPTEIPLGPRRGLDDVHPAHRETKEATGVESDSNTQASIEVSEASGTQAAAPTPRTKSKDRRATSEPPPTFSPVPITRDELYQKVWKSTLGKLVVELGTTHAELVRACEELNVPRPDHSYWSRLRLNLSVAVPPLPEPTPTMALEFLLRRKGVPGLRPAERTEAPPTKHAEKVPLLKPPTVPHVPKPKVVEFTRKELYEAIWSKPCVKLASELGISDVGLAKTCRRLGIPRPARGYWARIEAGEKLRRTTLPDAKPGQRDQVTFHVAENVARREEQALNYISTAGKGGKLEPVELPVEGVEIHPIAEKHRQALEKAKVGELGFVSIRSRNLFPSELTVGMIPLYARALHAVICELEDRDFEFTPGGGEYDGLQIARDGDHASLRWSEAKLHVEREPTAEEKRRPSWTWQLSDTKPAGKLSIEVSALGLKGKRKWTEGEGRSLEEVIGIIIGKLEAVFCGFEARRKREAEWAKQRAEAAQREAAQRKQEAEEQAKEEQTRKERERIQRHEAKLLEIAEVRRSNLAKAASEWVEARDAASFVEACADRWREISGGGLSDAQLQWLAWARAEVTKMTPFQMGYPDPALDGRFESSTVPAGGPYPESRVWPKKKIEQTTPVKSAPEARPPQAQTSPWSHSSWKY